VKVSVETKPCPGCGERGAIEMPEWAYLQWQSGALLQEAWPEGSPEEREQLITGAHPACWDKIVGPEE
jgi:hypothetical protein